MKYLCTELTFFQGGTPYPKGAVVTHQGWPRQPGLEAADDEAEKIMAYWVRHRHNPFLPAAPVDQATASIFLPGWLPEGLNGRWLAGRPKDAAEGMPLYSASHPAKLFDDEIWTDPAETFPLIAWPLAALTPANDPGKLVAEYFGNNHDNPALRYCPWNAFSGSLFLPELPPFKRHVPHWHYSTQDDLSRQSRSVDTRTNYNPFERRA